MATNALPGHQAARVDSSNRSDSTSVGSLLFKLLTPLASLRLTVALFAMAIFLVLAGTLAQVDKDIWQVMTEYFRTPLARIDFQVFFPPAFFTSDPPQVPGWFYFPGGFLIGGAMAVNLLAAHGLRFKVQAHGTRLVAGLGVIVLGVVLTWLVVEGGSGKDTIEGAAPFEWSALWSVLKLSLATLWVGGAWLLYKLDPARKFERWGLITAEAALGMLIGWLFMQGEAATLGDSSMRILWQLIKGGLAGLVLLAGCVMVFRKRAGIVLLHAGVALIMANELVVYSLHVEGQMNIREGETVNYVQDIRSVELAVVDPSNAKTDDVTVVPASLLIVGESLKHEDLPFDVDVLEYLQNSDIVELKAGEKNRATAGIGLKAKVEERRTGAGTDVGAKVDLAAAYVKLTDKASHKPLGVYLVSVALPEQKVMLGGKTYDLALRFKRTYKPYSMRLEDVRFDKYLGTQLAKNYSSDVRLVDKSQNVDRDVKIWMNNPLRFAGETFYQSGVSADELTTTLQVVKNAGWMIPYVACMLVGIGMMSHFSITLLRFLRRREEEDQQVPGVRAGKADSRMRVQPAARHALAYATSGSRLAKWWIPVTVVLLGGVLIAGVARPRHTPMDEMQVEEFGRLPLVYEGRVKPFDTVARNMLRYLSNKQTCTETPDSKTRQPAIKWLLDSIAVPERAIKYPVFRIENIELLQMLGLERREGLRYSIHEFAGKIGELERQAEQASDLEARKLSVYQKKVMELVKKLRLARLLSVSFDPPQLRPEHIQEDGTAAMRQLQALSRMQPPLAVPPSTEGGEWDTFAAAWFKGVVANARGQEPNPAMVDMTKLIVAYSKGDVKTFNSELAAYQNWLVEHKPEGYDEGKVGFEAFFNSFEPFYWAAVLYVVAFVLVALSWLGFTAPLNRAAFWLIVFTLGLHTFALVARIYISGRPPVTNLYSSAVFIGWGGVVLGLILEAIYKLGIGNVIAAVVGFVTLLIANFLAGLSDGDTLGVLQAVLDTQFWLATHVVCITLGYATTFIAGMLGVLYVLRGVLTPSLNPAVGKDLSRMIYGTLCFATFFSFVGTVLGGLWADDSWGRFWGWDPKENGALIIVLWNALVLHARWGGLVRQRGLAVLAIVGNIVTGWSWFGVNELGVGLHSYGFTEGVLMMLFLFIGSQLLVIALGLLPEHLWWSQRRVRST